MSTIKPPTLQNIALSANVSPSCASMILNGRNLSHFRQQTVSRVCRVAMEMGYTSHPTCSEAKQIGIFCPSTRHPEILARAQGAEQTAAKYGFDCSLWASGWNAQTESRQIVTGAVNRMQALMLVGSPQITHVVSAIGTRVPMMAITDDDPDCSCASLDAHDREAGRTAGEHMIRLGHRQVAFIALEYPGRKRAWTARLSGLREAVEGSDVSGHVIPVTYSPSAAELRDGPYPSFNIGKALARRFALSAQGCNAIVASDDLLACGAAHAIIELGLSIPQDYSVCGIGNLEFTHFAYAPMTTVDTHAAALGRAACLLLLNRLGAVRDAPEAPPAVQLIMRASTAAPGAR